MDDLAEAWLRFFEAAERVARLVFYTRSRPPLGMRHAAICHRQGWRK